MTGNFITKYSHINSYVYTTKRDADGGTACCCRVAACPSEGRNWELGWLAVGHIACFGSHNNNNLSLTFKLICNFLKRTCAWQSTSSRSWRAARGLTCRGMQHKFRCKCVCVCVSAGGSGAVHCLFSCCSSSSANQTTKYADCHKLRHIFVWAQASGCLSVCVCVSVYISIVYVRPFVCVALGFDLFR